MIKKEDFKTSVLNILKDHIGMDVSRKYIIEQTSISNSRLSEILHSIEADGYSITCPPRSGLVRLEKEGSAEILSPIKDSDIRQWLILFLLSKYGKMTFNDLLLKTIMLRDYNIDHPGTLIDPDNPHKHYDDSHLIKNLRKNVLFDSESASVAKDVVSVTVLRQDLTQLRNKKLVSIEKGRQTRYRLTNTAPYIIPLSGDSLYEFCQRYEEYDSSTTDSELLKQSYDKVTKLINLDGRTSDQHRFGKINDITYDQVTAFNSFITNNYKTNLIQFESGFNTKMVSAFAVGLLFYCTETSCFYALGENLTTGRRETRRLDRIRNITTLPEKNKIYHNPLYFQILDEMFSADYKDDLQKVKVLFQKYGNIPKRFNDLCSLRKNATIREIENPPEGCIYDYIYEDTMRGTSSFARYLRSFGMSVLAVEPPELKQSMIDTYNKIIMKYEELYENQ